MKIKILTKNLVLENFNSKLITKKYLFWLNNKQLMKYSDQRKTTHTKTSCLHYLKSFKKTNNYFLAVKKKLAFI